jgi:hypothetical protein
MNASMVDKSLEFQPAHPERGVGAFLAKFHAIFSLNQDLFLEHHYLSITFPMPHYGTWTGHELPGMEMAPGQAPLDPHSWGHGIWQPMPPERFVLSANRQPLYKLHGSANWRDRSGGGDLLVMGGDKAATIKREPVLAWYTQKFDELLQQGNTQLMIIGYGFLDRHINAAIEKAIERHGLRIFNISPEGGEHARRGNPTRATPGLVVKSNSLEDAFERGLIGASRRPLTQIFYSDETERKKVYRFFEA